MTAQYNITYRQKDKGWQYIISYKDNGKWKQKSKQGFETKKQASNTAREAVKELEKQLSPEDELDHEKKDMTFLEFANELIEHEKLYKEANTIINYQTALKNFSSLHNIPITKVKTLDLQKAIDKLAKDRLKLSSIKLYTSKIRYIFSQAIEPNRIITKNPVAKIKWPSQSLIEQTQKVKALTKEETEKLLSLLKEKYPKHYPICLLAVTTGLRIGEIMGLTWSDVDFDKAVLDINKQWKILKDEKEGFGSLKSKNSKRQVPIPVRTMNVLMEHKKMQKITTIDNRIFPNSTRSTVMSAKYAFTKLGYNISIHDLRHTFGTNLISNEIDFKTAAKLLGHDVQETLKTYSHVTDDMLQKASQIINEIY